MWDRLGHECRWIAGRCRRRLRCAVAFSLAFKVLNLIVLAPLATGVLRLCLSLWGRASVGNFELAAFFLSPPGLAALLLVGSLVVASLYLELAGLLRLLADDRLHWWEAFRSSRQLFPRLVQLGLRQLAMYLAVAVPFLAGVGAAYWWFWSGKDLNGLIILKPPEFWWGAGIAAALLAVYGFAALGLFLRQLYAVPILILESGTSARSALQASAERSRGRHGRAAAALAAWLVAQILFAATILALLGLALDFILDRSGTSIARVVLATSLVLGLQLVVVNLLSVLANISFVGVILALYRQVAPTGTVSDASLETVGERSLRGMPRGRLLAIGLVAGIAVAAVVSLLSLRGLALHDTLEITAHRAGATAAPENSIAALQQAIIDGADWAEIDVQLTADQALVIMHDIDLARVGGGSRRVDGATLAEIQALDIGTSFGPQFAGEKIPTLAEMLTVAGDRIRLNVELKPHSKADGPELTRRVIAEIRDANMLDRCRLCSQSYESLQLARQLQPQLELGYIVATAVGDPTKLEVNFLMVKGNLATRRFVDRARAHGIEVHAWTVNDPTQVGPLLDAGVANLITDDPARMRQRLEEIRALDTPERLLLRTAHGIAR
jgi:glycerophosphoryl diester phosphodiesterase